MIYSSLDSTRQDESNDSKIIQIGAIFAEIAIFAKFQVGLVGLTVWPDPNFRVGSCRVMGHGSRVKIQSSIQEET